MTLVILADDLTGAADSAARCHHAGIAAHIVLQPPTPPLPSGAIALSTDSRFLPPTEAAHRVQKALAGLSTQPVHWYKKIDSTLRGNLGAELDAMLTTITPASGQPCAIVCPAFPAQGRGLEDGYLIHVQTPARTIHLPTRLAEQTQRPMAQIGLMDVRAGVDQLALRLTTAQAQGAQLLVVDALTEADLATLLAATRRAIPAALLCGSAGLIEPLASSLISAEGPPGPNDKLLAQVRQPILAVVGSGSGMTHRQLEVLRTVPDVELVTLELERLPALGSEARVLQPRGWGIHLPLPAPQTALEGPAARSLVAQLAQVAVEAIKRLQPATLILVGGDTAVHVMEQLGIQQLTVVTELMPGIPLLAGVDSAGNEHRIVTKAGNFGDEWTLVRLFGARA
jgi:D-threonate/D-erythronate kinase